MKTIGEVLTAEMDWLAKVIDSRMRIYFQLEVNHASIEDIEAPELSNDTIYGMTVQKLSFEERLIVALALTPHIKPQLLDAFFIQNTTYHRRFSEFGGIISHQHAGFIPTGETALFIVAGDNIDKRIETMQLLSSAKLTGKNGLIEILGSAEGAPSSTGVLTCAKAFLKILFDN